MNEEKDERVNRKTAFLYLSEHNSVRDVSPRSFRRTNNFHYLIHETELKSMGKISTEKSVIARKKEYE